jgi:hypothetical protein
MRRVGARQSLDILFDKMLLAMHDGGGSAALRPDIALFRVAEIHRQHPKTFPADHGVTGAPVSI